MIKNLEDLYTLTQEEIEEFVEKVLVGIPNERLDENLAVFLYHPNSSPDVQLTQLYNLSEDQHFKEHFYGAVVSILNKWRLSPDKYSPHSFAYLFALAGTIETDNSELVRNQYETLVKYATDDRIDFRGREGDFEDLHNRLLAVLGSHKPLDERYFEVFIRDGKDPRYSELCNNILRKRQQER